MLLLLLISILASTYATTYKPTWASIDSRPLPSWYDDAKFGIFNHWGLYSVPSFGNEWFWWDWKGKKDPDHVKFMKDNYRPGFRYTDFAPDFKATFFNATRFAEVIAYAGAKYYVLTSKHHEGFTMWPSAYSWNWNANDTGPGRDIVGELAAAFKATQTQPDQGVRFGLYYSLFEWFHPLYLADKRSKFETNQYVREVAWPQMVEIVTKYNPEVIWSDGDWEAKDVYWNSTLFLAWLYNQSPVKDTVVTNDRWGIGTNCHHGGYYTCSDRYNPGVLQPHKWENAFTLDVKSWGYRRAMTFEDVMSIQYLIKTLAMTISCGGNILLNIGPTSDGTIVPIFEERLWQIGTWLRQGNDEAVYGSKPWIYQNDTMNPNVWYTSKVTEQFGNTLPQARLYNPQLPNGATVVYAFLLEWPKNGQLTLGAPTASEKTKVTLLGYGDDRGTKKLQFTRGISGTCQEGCGTVVHEDNEIMVKGEDGDVINEQNDIVVHEELGTVVPGENDGKRVRGESENAVNEENGNMGNGNNGNMVYEEHGTVVHNENGNVVKGQRANRVNEENGNIANEGNKKGMTIDLTKLQWWQMGNVWGWVLKLENLAGDPKKPYISPRKSND